MSIFFALARRMPMQERKHDAIERQDPALDIGEREAQIGRSVVAPLGTIHQPAHRLSNDIERREVTVRTGQYVVVSEPGNGAVDQAWIDLAQVRIPEPHPVHHVRPQILDHDIGLRGEFGEDAPAFRVLEIERDTLLVSIRP